MRARPLWLGTLAVVIVVMALLRLWVYPYSSTGISNNGQLFPVLEPPGWSHPFGTSSIGQDVFVRTTDGLLMSIAVLALGGVFAMSFGVMLNFLAFFGGRFPDKILGYVADALYSIPSLLIALSVLLGLPSDADNRLFTVLMAVSLSVGLFYGAKIFRALRVNISRERLSGYFVAAQAAGIGRLRLFGVHLLPNSMTGIRPLITGAGSEAILTLAGLGFVGVGISATDGADWGYDLSRGVSDLSQGVWWTTLFPALAISITVLVFSILTEGRGANDEAWWRLRRLQN